MENEESEIITQAINKLKQLQCNDVEIAINLLGGAVPVLIDAAGTTSTANYLHNLADLVNTSNLDNLN